VAVAAAGATEGAATGEGRDAVTVLVVAGTTYVGARPPKIDDDGVLGRLRGAFHNSPSAKSRPVPAMAMPADRAKARKESAALVKKEAFMVVLLLVGAPAIAGAAKLKFLIRST
jgi:hypothetical protein